MKSFNYTLGTVEFGNIGFNSTEQAFLILTRLFPDIANKELALKHILRMCKSIDDGLPFNLTDNKRSFAIGGFGAPTYISIF